MATHPKRRPLKKPPPITVPANSNHTRERLGACAHCYTPPEAFIPAMHPHERERTIAMPEDAYFCIWALAVPQGFPEAPPPYLRTVMPVREADCQACGYFVVAGQQLGEIMLKRIRRRKARARRAAAKARQGAG